MAANSVAMVVLRSAFLLASALAILGVACQGMPPQPRFAYTVEPACPAVESQDYYLPKGVLFSEPEQDDQLWRRVISSVFRAIAAAPLACGNVETTYRITTLYPSGLTVVVTLASIRDGGWLLSRTNVERRRAASEYVVAKSSQGMLSNTEGAALAGTLEQAGLWTERPQPWLRPEDGVLLLIEGRLGSGYQAVARLKRSPGTPLQQAAEAMGESAIP